MRIPHSKSPKSLGDIPLVSYLSSSWRAQRHRLLIQIIPSKENRITIQEALHTNMFYSATKTLTPELKKLKIKHSPPRQKPGIGNECFVEYPVVHKDGSKKSLSYRLSKAHFNTFIITPEFTASFMNDLQKIDRK